MQSSSNPYKQQPPGLLRRQQDSQDKKAQQGCCSKEEEQHEQQDYVFSDTPKAVELIHLALVTTQHALKYLQKPGSQKSIAPISPADNPVTTSTTTKSAKKRYGTSRGVTESKNQEAPTAQEPQTASTTNVPAAISALGSVPSVLDSALYQIQELGKAARTCQRDLHEARSVIQELVEVTGNQREALKEQRDSYSKLEQQKNEYRALVKELRQRLEESTTKCRSLQAERQDLLQTVHELAQEARKSSARNEATQSSQKQEPKQKQWFTQSQQYQKVNQQLKEELIKCQGENKLLQQKCERQKRIMEHLDRICFSHKNYIAQLTGRMIPGKVTEGNQLDLKKDFISPSDHNPGVMQDVSNVQSSRSETQARQPSTSQGIATGHRRLVLPAASDKEQHLSRPPRPPQPHKFNEIELDNSVGSWVDNAFQEDYQEDDEGGIQQYTVEEVQQTNQEEDNGEYPLDEERHDDDFSEDSEVLEEEDEDTDFFEEDYYDSEGDAVGEEEEKREEWNTGATSNFEPEYQSQPALATQQSSHAATSGDVESPDIYSYEKAIYEDDDLELERIKQEVRQQFDGSGSSSLNSSDELGSADVFAAIGSPSTSGSGYVPSASESPSPEGLHPVPNTVTVTTGSTSVSSS